MHLKDPEDIYYIDRLTKKEEKEKIYGEFFLKLLYGRNLVSRWISWLFLPLVAKTALMSRLYAILQTSRWSRSHIRSFVQKFQIDTSEFLDPISSFSSFNAFFIRKLKSSSRPLANGHDVAIMPADGRFLVYPNLQMTDSFFIKKTQFSLEALLQNAALAHKYAQGSMLLGRLAPVDYHRFHFPCHCIPQEPTFINGYLYSVNPIALRRNIKILSENKRVITFLSTKNFGTILYIEIGATHVGSIHQTFVPQEPYAKGDEKGYFSFGGSCLILLFEPFRIQFDQDLVAASHRNIEVRALMGQSLGRSLTP